jgi:nucleoside diphosphate kinase
METTLAIIKPDALEAGFKKEILHTIHRYKFTILKAGRFKVGLVLPSNFNL